ncbi:hypothetical protein D3C87_1543980 [compost metagenome]
MEPFLAMAPISFAGIGGGARTSSKADMQPERAMAIVAAMAARRAGFVLPRKSPAFAGERERRCLVMRRMRAP